MWKVWHRLRDQSAEAAIEYGLIGVLIAAALIVNASTLGNSFDSQFNSLSAKLNVQ